MSFILNSSLTDRNRFAAIRTFSIIIILRKDESSRKKKKIYIFKVSSAVNLPAYCFLGQTKKKQTNKQKDRQMQSF
uniref:Uncharacterized protein n=1 Tax=Anguilla anguilla TaxID=7936 RepID=A0A0E9W6S4_ANGAN